MASTFNVAVVGATGVVGTVLLSLLEERQFPVGKLYLLASQRSVGERRQFKNQHYKIDDVADFDFSQTQISFFCTGNDISATYAPKAAAAGNVVLDKSSYFRYDTDVPLVVPEVNAHALKHFHKRHIIASPNCNTIPLVVALKPIYDAVGISRMNVATYQSVSGTGKEAILELTEQTRQLLNNETIHPKVYPQQIAFNVLPHIDAFEENGYTREEMKIVWEMQKIMGDTTIAINPTAVRVPVYYGHSAAVHLETREKISLEEVLGLLAAAPGVRLMMGEHPYPTPAKDAAGQDLVYVGRVRQDLSHPHGFNMWVVADNLRKGAALNAVQIAETLIRQYLTNQ